MSRQVRMIAAALAAAALGAAVLAAAPALAGAALDEARGGCEIGEAINGYLEVVTGASPSAQARAEMNDINNRRREVYQNTARQNDVELSDVARLTGERQVARAAAANECYRDDGGWKMRR